MEIHNEKVQPVLPRASSSLSQYWCVNVYNQLLVCLFYIFFTFTSNSGPHLTMFDYIYSMKSLFIEVPYHQEILYHKKLILYISFLPSSNLLICLPCSLYSFQPLYNPWVHPCNHLHCMFKETIGKGMQEVRNYVTENNTYTHKIGRKIQC
jgi:hypothetical protein